MEDWMEIIMGWGTSYIKYRDLVAGKIKDMQVEKDRLKITNKDDSHEEVLAMPDLSKMDIAAVKLPTVFITLNKKDNLKFLTDKWKALSAVKEISIIFINPDSQLDTKWIIRPYVHARICDDKTLKVGLKSMFEMVDEIK
jgi:hypothetical protein